MAGQFLLMKSISKLYAGVQALDGVEFALDRREHIEQFTSKTSIDRGIHVIHQDLSLFPNLTAAENIAFNVHVEMGRKFVSWREIRRDSGAVMEEFGIRIGMDRVVGSLSIADQQQVAICRALIGKTQLLIMDEPTSSLTKNEVDSLFSVVRKLQTRRITTLFVSHKLNEILEIAEKVTVLRDGRKIGTFEPKDLDHDKLTCYMTGKKISLSKLDAESVRSSVLLEVKNLSRRGNYKNISFTLFRGEILGITGLLGSGRTELAQSLFGMNPAEEGQIFMDGAKVAIGSTSDAIGHGIGLVPENRLVQGPVMPQSVANNVVITILDDLLNSLGLLDVEMRTEAVKKWITDLTVKVASTESPVMTLSGGNQQRVVLAKWMATEPKILILDGPTIGIDVAAKSAIHRIIKQLAAGGIGIIVISDEVQEVLYNCHRILIMSKGRIVKELLPQETSEEELAQRYNLG